MNDRSPYTVRQLATGETKLFRDLLAVFGKAFEEMETYTRAQPGDAYLEELLDGNIFIAVVALQGDTVIGGLTAYELKKYEQERSEVFIYDLAVDAAHRRKGVATALIEHLKPIAAGRGAYVIIIESDVPDPPAEALYTKLGTREDVAHFNIEVP